MKYSKWFKWKVGAVGLLGLVILFQEVKASPAFELAYVNAAAAKDKPTDTAQAHDSVIHEWQQQKQTPSTEIDSGTTQSRKHKSSPSSQGNRSGSQFNSNSTNQTPENSFGSTETPNSRTGRS